MRMRQYIEDLQREALEKGLNSERQLLVRQIRRRFGELTAEASACLLAAIDDTTRLESLGEALLDCPDGEAWLAELRKTHS